MKIIRFFGIGVFALSVASAATADPRQDTCRFLGALGANDADSIAALVDDIAPAFSDQRRADVSNQIETMLESKPFSGGSAWVIASFGDDIEEHLILLRLQAGEITAGRLRYEWSIGDEMSVVSLQFQRDYAKFTERSILQQPERIECE